jgi:hypothetical protein
MRAESERVFAIALEVRIVEEMTSNATMELILCWEAVFTSCFVVSLGFTVV